MTGRGLARDGAERRGPTLTDRVVYLLGVFGLAASITAVWMGMRAVMDIGGSCASGGPYEVVVPCPDGVDLLMFLAFPLGFLSAAVIVWKGVRLGGGWTGVAALAWPALFLSLGWNFLEYGLWPPYGGGIELGWLIPGVLFVLMGGVPLAVWLWSRGDAPIVPGIAGTRARSDVRELGDLRDAMARAARTARTNAGPSAATMSVFQATHGAPRGGAAPSVGIPGAMPGVTEVRADAEMAAGSASGPTDDPGEVLVSQLERLARLRDAGALSIIEFQAAKSALLARSADASR